MATQIFKSYEEFLDRPDMAVNGVSEEFASKHPYYEADNETNEGCWNCRDCIICYSCSNCTDCRNCRDCTDCRSCHNCHNCHNCDGCRDCHSCTNCHSCTDCIYCANCVYCTDCRKCTDCHNCHNCANCHNCDGCRNCHYCHNCTDCHYSYSCHYCHKCRNCRNCKDCFNSTGKSDEVGDFLPPVIDNVHQKVLSACQSDGALDMDNWHACETTHCRAGWAVHLAGEAGYELESNTDTAFSATLIYRASSTIEVPATRFYQDSDAAMEDIKRCAELEIELNNSTAQVLKPE